MARNTNSFNAHWQRYEVASRAKGITANTISTWKVNLRMFFAWCEERDLSAPSAITYPILSRYQRHLYLHRRANGEALSSYTQASRLTAVRSFFKWLTKERYILYNPASELELPQRQRRLPKVVLSEGEVTQLLNAPNINDPWGLRDRAILEILYSTGMRRMELTNLTLDSINYSRGIVFIAQGKGQKDRIVPIGERALVWLKCYRDSAYPLLSSAVDEKSLFITHLGHPLHKDSLSNLVRSYVEKVLPGKAGSCHLLRHAMATHMLEHGADIRYIQEMLGHARLDTTQIYTQVSIVKLQAIHKATHPAKLAAGLYESLLVNEAAGSDEKLPERLLKLLDADEEEAEPTRESDSIVKAIH